MLLVDFIRFKVWTSKLRGLIRTDISIIGSKKVQINKFFFNIVDFTTKKYLFYCKIIILKAGMFNLNFLVDFFKMSVFRRSQNLKVQTLNYMELIKSIANKGVY